MEENKTVFFVTVIETKNRPRNCPYSDSRTWGYYFSKETAIRALHENWTDMRENVYDLAVIEEFGEGICPTAKYEQYFKWDEEKQGYFEIEIPEEFHHLCNFAIG